jgi:predicted RNase H-like HicB family nuclease
MNVHIHVKKYGEDNYFATCSEVPNMYGCGETKEEAEAMLRREIDSFLKDLAETDDDDLCPELLEIKKRFARREIPADENL